MWAVLLVFFLDDDIFHEISFEFLERFGIEGGLLEAVFAVVAVLSVGRRTWRVLFWLILFLQLRK